MFFKLMTISALFHGLFFIMNVDIAKANTGYKANVSPLWSEENENKTFQPSNGNLILDSYVQGDSIYKNRPNGLSLRALWYLGKLVGENPLLQPDGSERTSNNDPKADSRPFIVTEYQLPKGFEGEVKAVAQFHQGAAGPDKTKPSQVDAVKIKTKETLDVMVSEMENPVQGDPAWIVVKTIQNMEDSDFNAGQNGAIPLIVEAPANNNFLSWTRARLELWMKTTLVFGVPLWPWYPSQGSVVIHETLYKGPQTAEEKALIDRKEKKDNVTFAGKVFYNLIKIRNPILAAFKLLRSETPIARQDLVNYKHTVGHVTDITQDLKEVQATHLISSYRELWKNVTPRRWDSMMEKQKIVMDRSRHHHKQSSIKLQDETAETVLDHIIAKNKNTVGAVVHVFEGDEAYAMAATSTNGLTGARKNRVPDNGGYTKFYHFRTNKILFSFSVTGVGESIIEGIVEDIGGAIKTAAHPVEVLLDKLQELPVDSLGIIAIVTDLETGETRVLKGTNTPKPSEGMPTGVVFKVQDKNGETHFLTYYETGIEIDKLIEMGK